MSPTPTLNKTSLLTASLQKQASSHSDSFPAASSPQQQSSTVPPDPFVPRNADTALRSLVSSSVPTTVSHTHYIATPSTPPPHSAMLPPSTPVTGGASALLTRSQAMPVVQDRRTPYATTKGSPSSLYSNTPVRNPALARVQSQDIPKGSLPQGSLTSYSASPSGKSLGACATPVPGGTASSLGVASVTDGNDQVLAYFADPDVDVKEAEFEQVMNMNGLAVHRVPGDGMCLYAALGACMAHPADELHTLAMDFVARNATYFAPFLCEDVATYVARKQQHRSEMAFGNHVELLALACALRVVIHVHETDWTESVVDPSECPVFQGAGSATGGGLEVVRVWHHGGHYDALVPAMVGTDCHSGSASPEEGDDRSAGLEGDAGEGVHGFWENV